MCTCCFAHYALNETTKSGDQRAITEDRGESVSTARGISLPGAPNHCSRHAQNHCPRHVPRYRQWSHSLPSGGGFSKFAGRKWASRFAAPQHRARREKEGRPAAGDTTRARGGHCASLPGSRRVEGGARQQALRGPPALRGPQSLGGSREGASGAMGGARDSGVGP